MITNRETIAAQLSTVAGLTGYAKRPDVLIEGVAYPLVDQLTRGPGYRFGTTWRVLVVLSPDEFTAADSLDELAPLVTEALVPVLFIDSVTPIAIPTEGGELFVAEFLGRSE